MADTVGFHLSKLLTDLVGRKVTFAPLPNAVEQPIKQVFGIYQLLPWDLAIVVRLDLSLLGSLAGLLVGLPDNAVKDRLKAGGFDELLRDAAHEVLNISSAVITAEGRAIFQKMVFDRTLVDGPAGEVLKKPFHKSFYNVVIDGYQGGKLAVLGAQIPIS
ncbi:hypothetical protein SAMN05421819_0610 [Bryocella elongata]|uniref:Chemotaxis phosphatase CheX-like domain-containing protein n=1 Tax=Bryocella elongata TaxID=863522 RepID=A0A1H5THC6_9BACT|nr:hypothetical protein [Bryocella elongata]SEF62160.1 hypothetical protein SAMN05421819_0610 [Bryocella elongata]